MDWDNVDWSKFSEHEAHRCVTSMALTRIYSSLNTRLRHRMIEEKHRGHEAMHAEMILILFVAAILAQVILVVWRLRHKKSYHVSVSFYLSC